MNDIINEAIEALGLAFLGRLDVKIRGGHRDILMDYIENYNINKKRCSRCSETKEIKEFIFVSTGIETTYCRTCRNDVSREYRDSIID